ncbi:MAG: nucleotidyltransferase [Firmicutes bacterium]|nr:nucleotidyltransferase [Bacillota bacterium]
MNKPTLVIMAAGMGSRYGGLKQIDKVSGNDIILDFSLFDARRAGFGKAVIIIKKENEADFRALIDDRAGHCFPIEYAYQDLHNIPEGFTVPEDRAKPWGTAHAVMSAADHVHENFAVINADDYYGPEAFRVMAEFLMSADPEAAPYPFSMVGYNVENTLTENGYVSRGVCTETEDGFLADIVERTKIMRQDGEIVFEDEGSELHAVPEGTPVSMNFWGFTPAMMEEIKAGFPAFLENAMENNPLKGEYLLPKCVDDLIKEGKATARMLKSHDRWYGVTYKEDKESVSASLNGLKASGLYPEDLWK